LKPSYLLAGAFVFLLMGYTSFHVTFNKKVDSGAYHRVKQKIRLAALRCSPDWSDYIIGAEEVLQMGPLPGTGTHAWKISTASDSAQFYFNQGINLYYGFHIVEALPSFKKAILFDSGCTMLYWAVALAYGPNINDYGYAASPDALSSLSKAKLYLGKASHKEGDLLKAMESHYSADSTKERTALNQDYANSMKTLYQKYPNDAEIGALYADALMNLHPWDLWNHDGTPKPWTPELRKILEHVLKTDPQHPGANHYYIHTMEASPFASKANPSAERLAGLTPGLSHMVHMPSHIYIRTGDYSKGIRDNEDAIKTYLRYKKIFPAVESSAFLYDYHNRHMQAACSINTNDYNKAIKDAEECRDAIDTSNLSLEAPMGNLMQYLYLTPSLTRVTFEKWDEILKDPVVSEQYHYGRLIQEFARGMAFANKGKIPETGSSLALIDSLLALKDMSVVMTPFNAVVTGGRVAKYILMGTIKEKENNLTEAIAYYSMGVKTEDSLVYQEPRDWLVPARHYLGSALLKQKKYKEAEQVFLKDLTYQPRNYISTTGLAKARKNKIKS
jgi:tetratricopeptide (TPR) repeat protein